MRSIFAAAAALLFTAQALANDVPVETYRYGTDLDVARVLSIKTPESRTCAVVTAVMTYEDSQGQLRKLAYQALPENCSQQN